MNDSTNGKWNNLQLTLLASCCKEIAGGKYGSDAKARGLHQDWQNLINRAQDVRTPGRAAEESRQLETDARELFIRMKQFVLTQIQNLSF